MSNITITNKNAVSYTQEQIETLKKTLLDTEKVTFTKDELSLFINQCERTGLDPFSRQIYATKIKGKVSIQATIDGLRLIAERSGKYAGQTRPTFFDENGTEYKIWPKSKGFPYACEVGVLRHDFKEPVYAIAIFSEYVQKNYDGGVSFMWNKMPALMISKTAEALALRRAFPNDMSGIYSKEEMDNSSNEEKDVTQPPQQIQGSTQEIKDLNKKAIETKQAQVDSRVIQPEELENALKDKKASLIIDVPIFDDSEPMPSDTREVKQVEQEQPAKPKKAPNRALGIFKFTSGKHAGKMLSELRDKEIENYIKDLEEFESKNGKPLPQSAQETLKNMKGYLGLE